MEMITYIPPQSWNDKGMNWSAEMNALTIDYAVAIKDAILERLSILHGCPIDFKLLTPGIFVPVRYDFFVAARYCLMLLAPSFINLEYQSTKDDFSDVPKYWSYRDLNLLEECKICEIPSIGSPAPEMVQWMIRAKNYINKLLVHDGEMRYKTASGICDYVYTSYMNAKRIAMESYNFNKNGATFSTAHSVTFGSYQVNIGKGYYDPYATSAVAEIKTVWQIQAPPHGENARKFKTCVIFVSDTSRYSKYGIVNENFWDNGEFGINQGVTIREFSADAEFDITTSDIPTNTMKPQYPSGERFYAISIGMWGAAYFFRNYGVNGGFKFRP